MLDREDEGITMLSDGWNCLPSNSVKIQEGLKLQVFCSFSVLFDFAEHEIC
jgi:hypothetical protein